MSDRIVKMVRLISGEELISNVQFCSADTISLDKTLQVMMVPKQGGNVGITFVPFCPYLDHDEPLQIDRSNVVFTHKVDQEMEQQYRKMVGLPVAILTQKKGLILPT